MRGRCCAAHGAQGGTLIDYNGQVRLLELAQVPKEYVEEFKRVSKFRIFNTNNLWISLSSMRRLVEEKAIHMEVIENKKVRRPHSPPRSPPQTLSNGIVVVQLETAVGSGIKSFKNGLGWWWRVPIAAHTADRHQRAALALPAGQEDVRPAHCARHAGVRRGDACR